MNGHSILDRTRWVQVFHLGKDGCHTGFNDIVELDQRCVTNQIENAITVIHVADLYLYFQDTSA